MGAMDGETSKLYIQNLEEYVLDEGKIVTYKWLSRELNLHVNLAKQLLHTFLKQHQKVVHATYLLSGLLQDEVTHKVLVVQEDDLEKAKSQFKRVSSEHVYSVQKAKQIADLNSLYIIDRYNKDISDIKSLNAIRCNEAVERAADEIAKLKIKARAASATTDARAWPAAKKKVTTEANKEMDSAATISEEKTETKKEETVKKKEIKTGGIAAMFAAQSSKNQKQETTEKSRANGKPAPKAKSGIAMFFNRNAEKPKEKSKQSVPPAVKDENSDSGFDSKDSQPVTDDEAEHKELVNDETKTPESKVNTKGKSKPDSIKKEKKANSVKCSTGKTNNKRKASDDPPTKKRKRIVCVSDSEDSDNDIFGKDEEDEDEAPNPPLPVPEPTPASLVESDEEVIPPTPRGERKPGRKRERKLKVSTFMDEEGYVVTKKEYVVESCTDSEGEEKKENMNIKDNNSDKVNNEKKSPSLEPPAKKKCSPQKVKQATLMNFFKKK